MRNVEKSMSSGWALAATLLAAIFFAGFTGCAADDAKQDQGLEGPVPQSWAVEDVPELTLTDDGKAVPGPEQPQAGCSFVEWCNAPGADGSRCRQEGCTIAAAIAECESETRQFCGTPQCPWIMVASDGTRYRRTPCP
jgi:hypothetical protein